MFFPVADYFSKLSHSRNTLTSTGGFSHLISSCADLVDAGMCIIADLGSNQKS